MAPRSKIMENGEKPCPCCAEVFLLDMFYTTGKTSSGETKYNSWCKNCIKKKMASYHKRTYGPEALQFYATRRTRSARSYLTYLLAKARKRHECTIRVEFLERLWATQGGRCALSGTPMTMVLGSGVQPHNVSIDRICSDEPYVEGNVQLVCRCVNVAKSDLKQDDFIALCRAVVEMADGKDASMAA